MSPYDYDLFTIGAGSGGVRASRFSAQIGARVAIAESTYLGGTCINVGCVPKKLLSFAAHYHEDFEDAAGFGWRFDPQQAAPRFDWGALIAAKDTEIARLNQVYEGLLRAAGVALFKGRARVVDAHTVEVAGQRFTAEHILVATGGWPVRPDLPGAELGITSNEAFHLPDLPRRVVVYGGGYIAVEFASIFNGLGAETHLVYRGTQLLKEFDADLGSALAEEMAAKGVHLHLSTKIARIEGTGAVPDGTRRVQLDDDSVLDADCVLFATGRAPNVADVGLNATGVACAANGAVIVDKDYRSSVPSILAIGDVIDRVALTPVATAEGMVVADHLFGKGERRFAYNNIPTAVFSHPNVGTVGLSEDAARQRYGAIRVFQTRFRPLRHMLSGRQDRVFMKLVVDAASDRVVGVHMVGPEAGEIMQGFAVALQSGATKAQFDATVGIHPTIAEEFVTMREAVR